MARERRRAPMKHQGQTGSDMAVMDIVGIFGICAELG
jgi:hypothetical protein